MPTFDPGVFDPGAFDSGSAAAGDISPPLLDQTAAVFAPIVFLPDQFLTLAVVNQIAAPFMPTITGDQDVSLPLIGAVAAAGSSTATATATSFPTAIFMAENDPYAVAPRDYKIITDGKKLINDAMVWATAPGFDGITFAREEAPVSQAVHGLWQYGEFNTSMYKQSSVNKRADSIVNGNNITKIGARRPLAFIEATVFEPIFQLGDVVTCVSEVFEGIQYRPFGNNDASPPDEILSINLPIRQMVISFPTGNTPVFRLLLTQELDLPWSIYESIWPRVRPGGLPPETELPPTGDPVGCSDCGITDTFTRTVSNGWGTADSGLIWSGTGTSQFSVGGAAAAIALTAPGGNAGFANLYGQAVTDVTVIAQVTSDDGSPSSGRAVVLGADSDSDGIWLALRTDGVLDMSTYNNSASASTSVDPYSPFKLRFKIDGANVKGKVWQASVSEPAGWDHTLAVTVAQFDVDCFLALDASGVAFTQSIACAFDDLDALGLNRCDLFTFDIFNRTVSSGWGTATNGYPWQSAGPGGATAKVEGGIGKNYSDGSATSGQARQMIPNAVTLADIVGDDFTMTARFQWYQKPSPWTNQYDQLRQHPAQLMVAVAIQSPGYSIPDQGVSMFVRNPFSGDVDTLSLVRYDGASTTQVAFPWTEGAWYWLKFERSLGGATIRAKVWLDGTSEPTGWLLEETGDTPATAGRLVVFRQAPNLLSFDNAATTIFEDWWDSIDFDYNGKPCYEGGPLPVTLDIPPPTSGQGSETFTSGGTDFFTSVAFVTGTAKVWVNELLLTPGTGYTQFGASGHITLAVAVSSGDVVVITYEADGEL